MYVREHIEELITNRLTRQLATDLPDSLVERDFKALVPAIDVAINKVLWRTNIPGFTDEDLVSFMYLKAHQLLRRQKYDFDKNPYSFFYTAFSNLMKDIVRAQNFQQCLVMHIDMIDFVVDRHFEEATHIEVSVL